VILKNSLLLFYVKKQNTLLQSFAVQNKIHALIAMHPRHDKEDTRQISYQKEGIW